MDVKKPQLSKTCNADSRQEESISQSMIIESEFWTRRFRVDYVYMKNKKRPVF